MRNQSIVGSKLADLSETAEQERGTVLPRVWPEEDTVLCVVLCNRPLEWTVDFYLVRGKGVKAPSNVTGC